MVARAPAKLYSESHRPVIGVRAMNGHTGEAFRGLPFVLKIALLALLTAPRSKVVAGDPSNLNNSRTVKQTWLLPGAKAPDAETQQKREDLLRREDLPRALSCVEALLALVVRHPADLGTEDSRLSIGVDMACAPSISKATRSKLTRTMKARPPTQHLQAHVTVSSRFTTLSQRMPTILSLHGPHTSGTYLPPSRGYERAADDKLQVCRAVLEKRDSVAAVGWYG